jgi:hypothetical protein
VLRLHPGGQAFNKELTPLDPQAEPALAALVGAIDLRELGQPEAPPA